MDVHQAGPQQQVQPITDLGVATIHDNLMRRESTKTPGKKLI